MNLDELFEQLHDGPMKDALREANPEFAEEMLRDYFDSTCMEQADIRAFFDTDGPARMAGAKLGLIERMRRVSRLETALLSKVLGAFLFGFVFALMIAFVFWS